MYNLDYTWTCPLISTFISLSQALCPDDKICVAMGVRSVVAPTLNALFYAAKGVYGALGSLGEVLLR